MELNFRQGKEEDLDAIAALFEKAILHMDRQGIPQWDEVYPNREVLQQDIEKQQLYVGLWEGQLASVYVLNRECDPDYASGDWTYRGEEYRIIHRLCVDPSVQNQGIGRNTMQHIENELIRQGIKAVRLDAFTRNPYALRMYEGLGYQTVGHADWRKGRFYLMEKLLG